MSAIRAELRPSVRTVTEYSQGQHERPRKAPTAASGRTSRVRGFRVDRRVMAVALRCAGGDASRLRIVSATEVIVS